MAGLITRCPGCASSFKVSFAQLQVAGGKVRCGACQQIFNGHEHIIAKQVISEKGLIEQPIDSDDLLIYDEMPLEQDQSVVAESEPESELELNEVDKMESFSIPSPSSFLEPPILKSEPHQQKTAQAFLWLPLALLSICALVVQLAHFNALVLTQKIPMSEPLIAGLCEITGCQLYGYDAEKLIIADLQVVSHPQQKGALRISGSLVNQASFPQQMPTLLIAFDSLEGTTVAQRSFSTNEYVVGGIPPKGLLSAKRKFNFQLDIVDPGSEAQSYWVEVY